MIHVARIRSNKEDVRGESGRLAVDPIEGSAQALIIEQRGVDALLFQKSGQIDISKSLLIAVEPMFAEEQGHEESNNAVSMKILMPL